jgi:hypothetical protein
MAALGPDDPKDPRVRAALGWLRVASVFVVLVLVPYLVFDREHGGFEYLLALMAFLAGLLGLQELATRFRKE